MLHLLRRSLLVAVLCSAAATASAQAADTISLSFGADPTEEVPFTVTANATPSSETSIYVTVKPAGGLGCAANYSADDANSSDVFYAAAASTGKQSRNWDEEDPGDYTYCGYLQDGSTVHAVTGPINLKVRDAKATLSVTAPARVDSGKPYEVVAQVTAEVHRNVRVTIKPSGGRGCEANYAADDANSSDVIYDSAQGTQTLRRTLTAGDTPGMYLLCGYVDEGGQGVPEAVASTEFRIGPDPCLVAKAAEADATTAVATAEAAVTRYRRSWKRFAAKARRASGARARRFRALAKRDRSRYRSAVRRRAAKRAALVTAQAARVQACGG